MASERRVVSQQLLWVLELNWQFVILIALTLLHPGRSEIGQGEVPGNQFMDYLSFTSLSFPYLLVFLQPSCTHSISLSSTLMALFLISDPLSSLFNALTSYLAEIFII